MNQVVSDQVSFKSRLLTCRLSKTTSLFLPVARNEDKEPKTMPNEPEGSGKEGETK